MMTRSNLIAEMLREQKLTKAHAGYVMVGGTCLPIVLDHLSALGREEFKQDTGEPTSVAGSMVLDAARLPGIGKRCEFSFTLGLDLQGSQITASSISGTDSRAPGNLSWTRVTSLREFATGVPEHKGNIAKIARGVEAWALSSRARPILLAALAAGIEQARRNAVAFEKRAAKSDQTNARFWQGLATDSRDSEPLLRKLYAAWKAAGWENSGKT
jgi:hypothetical protein